MNNRSLGGEKEQMAIDFLREKGYFIIESNFRVRQAEIDIVARDDATIVFVEVKYRSTSKTGHPLEAVDYRKQQKITKVSQCYLFEKHMEDVPIRYDVVGILGEDITLIKNAF